MSEKHVEILENAKRILKDANSFDSGYLCNAVKNLATEKHFDGMFVQSRYNWRFQSVCPETFEILKCIEKSLEGYFALEDWLRAKGFTGDFAFRNQKMIDTRIAWADKLIEYFKDK